jgi:phosphohistidine phosphatase SixA
MKRIVLRAAALAAIALHAATPATAAEPSVARETTAGHGLPRPALVAALKAGGLVIYIRHGATEHSQADSDRLDFAGCATQRNLSPVGREQARGIGAAFRAQGIRVDRVISSPYCRAKETSQLAFDGFEISESLAFTMRDDEARTAQRAESLRRMLATTPAKGKNTVLVAHTSNLKEATGIWPKVEAMAVVFRPLAGGGFENIGSIMPEDWTALARGEN